MALNGAIFTQVDNYFELELRWSATQNSSNNTSTITTILYWRSLHRDAALYSNNTREGVISVTGTAGTNYVNPSLSGNQTKEITRVTKTIAHKADGTLDVMLYSRYTFMLTISGTYYSEARCDGSISLNRLGGTQAPPKVWNGSSWVNGTVRVWNGSSWAAPKGLSVWDGSRWVK